MTDSWLSNTLLLEDVDDLANRIADRLRSNSLEPDVLRLCQQAETDAAFRERLGQAVNVYFGCCSGMFDKALIPFLTLARELKAREAFEMVYRWFTTDRLEGTLDPLPIAEDDTDERRPIVSTALRTIAELQPPKSSWMSNFWVQIWYSGELVTWHVIAFHGLLVQDPVSAVMELPELMRRGALDQLDPAPMLEKIFHESESRAMAIESIKRGLEAKLDWAIKARRLIRRRLGSESPF